MTSTSLAERSVLGLRSTAAGPSRRAILVFPVVVVLLAVVATILGLNGWSTGVLRDQVTASHDPRVIWGVPRPVRRDEWYVQSVWSIAQVQQGLPEVNWTFPFGMDASIPQDLPRADWSVAFRPHQWGFLALPPDQAFAAKWWILVVGLVLSVYLLGVVLLRRPLVAAVIATAFALSPFFQWWFLAPTVWPIVWGAVTVAAVEVAARGGGRSARWSLAAASGYLVAVVGMGVYVPFIVPVALVVALWSAGRVVVAARTTSARVAAGRAAPIVIASVIGAAVVGIWLLTRARTVEAFLSTVYPGPRITPSGSGRPLDAVQTLADSFAQALGAGGLLGQNSSEGSTFFLAGLFLIPVVVLIVAGARRRRDPLPWELVGVLAALLVVVLFLAVPHLGLLGQVTLLDRVPSSRLRIGLGFASLLLLLAVLARAPREARPRRIVAVAAVSALVYLASQALIAVALGVRLPAQLGTASAWWLIAAAGAAVIVLATVRRGALAAATALLVLSAATGAWVDPLYRGVYDTRATAASEAVRHLPAQAGRHWVAVGGDLPAAILIEAGVTTYNGFQGAPSRRMWAQIDPADRFEAQWNRLALVTWTAGSGAPVVDNPFPDRIRVSFDACSAFAQEHVGYVLSDERGLRAQACLTPIDDFRYRSGDLTVYRVTSGRAPAAN